MTRLEHQHDAEWAAPPLSEEDERIVEAYRRAKRPLDDLPYTEAFDQMCEDLGLPDTQAAKHGLFRRLLTLRKTGRLPRHSSRDPGGVVRRESRSA